MTELTLNTIKPAVQIDDDALRKQVAAQCKAVAHMASAVASVHADKAKMLEAGRLNGIHDFVGWHTAHLMEKLGNILNGMDAHDPDEDDWLEPIFAEAQRLWPKAPAAGASANAPTGGTK